MSDLRALMQKRIQGKALLRSSGANPRMSQVCNRMDNKEFEENKDVIFDMQKDVKGKKGAKKLAKGLMSGMDNKQKEQMSKEIASKAPGSSKEFQNIMGAKTTKRKKNKKEDDKKEDDKKEDKKEDKREEKIYIPVNKMSQDDILLKQNSQPIKKFKQFAKIPMIVPKLTELKSFEASKKAETNICLQPQVFTKASIDDLFVDKTYKSLLSRVKDIDKFNPNQILQDLQLDVMQNGGKLIKIIRVISYPKQKFIGLPGSEKVCEVPSNWDGKDILCLGKYGYKIQNNQCIQSENVIDECYDFLSKVEKIKNWLTALQGQTICLDSLSKTLNKFGIFLKSITNDSVLSFYLYCNEYDVTKLQISVPQIPFIYLKIQ
jgi:hypothetical protein